MKNSPNTLPTKFYDRPTLTVAKDLLGTYLIRSIDGVELVGKIVETEAYIGEDDPACHAASGLTRRTEIMYGPPGYAYVYIIYGMYYCLNAVTEAEGFPAAVLIRGIEPINGVEQMQMLRKQSKPTNLTNGPGKLCQAFNINKEQNGTNLQSSSLIITKGEEIDPTQILSSPRIGITKAVNRPWRFYLDKNPFVSRR